MNLTSNIIINMYSVLLLTFIYIHASKHTEKKFIQHKLYLLIVQVSILMLVFDILSRFDGNPGTIYSSVNHVGNFLVFLFNPILPSLWLLYAHFQVSHQETKTTRLIYPLLTINIVNIVLLIITQFYGWFYYIDSLNIYHRGRFFWIPASISIGLNIASFILVIVNRKSVEKKYYLSLVLFPTLPLMCILLQIIFYGLSLIMNGVALSLFIVFLNIQNRSMHIDYLTGVYNRKKLEAYMKEKINTSNESKTFSAILIDLDNFKTINDTFGHGMGDEALEIFVVLLKSSLRSTDFIARYGGDEFYIILEVSNIEDLEATVNRINRCIEEYNEKGIKPYKISLSMGYAVYDYSLRMEVEEFQEMIDMLMYENKRASKE